MMVAAPAIGKRAPAPGRNGGAPESQAVPARMAAKRIGRVTRRDAPYRIAARLESSWKADLLVRPSEQSHASGGRGWTNGKPRRASLSRHPRILTREMLK